MLASFAAVSNAALKPMTDEQMSGATGQAFLQLDRSNANGLDYTRLTLGLDVETSLNSDLVELGKYNRNDDPRGDNTGADIRIRDFALGEVKSNGVIEPFQIKDPFIELAFEKGPSGQQNVVGVRLGFGGAKGKLSGAIESLTGNIDVNVFGKGNTIAPKISCGFFDLICAGAKALVGGTWANSEFKANASLIDGSGNSDPIRATKIGILNGQNLTLPGSSRFANFIVGLLKSNNCDLLGTTTCFPLTNFKSLDIGNNGDFSQGLFLSFQTKSVAWRDGSGTTTATKGAFINIPNGGINVSFTQAFDGIPRVRTKLLDPYVD